MIGNNQDVKELADKLGIQISNPGVVFFDADKMDEYKVEALKRYLAILQGESAAHWTAEPIDPLKETKLEG